ncbi:MAG TPA: hypothetical protein VHK04_11135, partial [Castellaniella sp.]|nr:hypothetical protein [Castellaniella sp.]
RTSSWVLKKAAVEEGMRTLRQDGWIKVLAGRTTVDEIVKATKGEQGVMQTAKREVQTAK